MYFTFNWTIVYRSSAVSFILSFFIRSLLPHSIHICWIELGLIDFRSTISPLIFNHHFRIAICTFAFSDYEILHVIDCFNRYTKLTWFLLRDVQISRIIQCLTNHVLFQFISFNHENDVQCIVSVVCYIQICTLYRVYRVCTCIWNYIDRFENQNRISFWFGQRGINPILKIDSNESINQLGP